MNALLVTLWEKVRNSYWFVPSLMVLGAIGLSFAATALDNEIGSAWMDDVSWMYTNKPAGARAVLSTVAGSMITVAGVTFSMTILSISHTTSQIGPRLLNNFMADKANQFTLGVFISTFIYCLLVLRTVRNAESVSPAGIESSALSAAFVPHIAITIGVMMAIMSVGVLIFFVHHIPESIHVSNLIAGVGQCLNIRIETQFPDRVGEPHETDSDQTPISDLPVPFYRSAKSVAARCDGYIEYIDGDALLNIASKHDLVVQVQRTPGDFVTSTSVILLASPEDRIDDFVEDELCTTFISGTQRTPTQDLRFLFNQLVEVAMRALSPGVNDPFTAISCMDWLQSALENLATRVLPESHRYDDNQKLRLVAEPVTFSVFASLVFDQLRPYVAADGNAAIKMMEMLGNLLLNVSCERDQRLLVRHACALRRECRQSLTDSRALQVLSNRYRDILLLCSNEQARTKAKSTGHWIGISTSDH